MDFGRPSILIHLEKFDDNNNVKAFCQNQNRNKLLLQVFASALILLEDREVAIVDPFFDRELEEGSGYPYPYRPPRGTWSTFKALPLLTRYLTL